MPGGKQRDSHFLWRGSHHCPHLGIDRASNQAIVAIKLARCHVEQGGEEHDRAAIGQVGGMVVGEAAKKLREWAGGVSEGMGRKIRGRGRVQWPSHKFGKKMYGYGYRYLHFVEKPLPVRAKSHGKRTLFR